MLLSRRIGFSLASVGLLLVEGCGQKGPLLLPDAYAHRHDEASAGSNAATPVPTAGSPTAAALPATPGGPATSDASMSPGSPLGPATGPILEAPDPSTTRKMVPAAATRTAPANAPAAPAPAGPSTSVP